MNPPDGSRSSQRTDDKKFRHGSGGAESAAHGGSSRRGWSFMPDRAGWFELAATGMDAAALAAAGWYLFARSFERDRRAANRRLAEFNELKKRYARDSGDADRSLPPDFYRSPVGPDAHKSLLNMTLPADPLEDRGGEGTEAEEL